MIGRSMISIEEGRFGGDGYRFARPADLQLDVDLELIPHRERQLRANGFLETGRLHGYLVWAGRQQRRFIETA